VIYIRSKSDLKVEILMNKVNSHLKNLKFHIEECDCDYMVYITKFSGVPENLGYHCFGTLSIWRYIKQDNWQHFIYVLFKIKINKSKAIPVTGCGSL
jgi:hypothetical protein